MWMNPNNKGYIRATTISSEKFIIIGSENIELSGNVIMKNDVTLSSGLFNTNSIVPNITNSKSLGTSSKIWSNAYIQDLSINNNIEISGNTIINGVLQAPNIYTNSLDVSGNVTISGSTLYVPSSFTIDPIGHGDNTGTVLINGNLVVQGLTTTINSSVVDISDKMLVLASNASNPIQADGAGFEISGAKVNFLYNNSSASFRSSIGISISGNVVPLTNSVGSLGETGKIWDIAYIRELNVTNFTNSIDGVKIASGTISSTQIANGSILGTDISNDTITGANIAHGTLQAIHISNDTISGAKIAHGTIQSIHIENGTIMNSDISNSAAIAFSKINTANAIVNADISNSAAIAFSKINTANAIVNADISNSAAIAFSKINTANAIMNSDISNSAAIAFSKINASLAITDSHISASAAISGSKIANTSITATQIANTTITAAQIANTTITAAQIANATITAAQIANASITSDKINQTNNWTFSQLTANNLSINTINGAAYSAGGGSSTVLTSVTSDILPSTTNIYNIGSATNVWNSGVFTNIIINGNGAINTNAANPVIFSNASFRPSTSGVGDLGGSSNRYRFLHVNQIFLWVGMTPDVDNTIFIGSSTRRYAAMFAMNLTVAGTFTNTSDDRVKHNEVIIANGLDVIDRLTPKFYQKTIDLLDASYNGDLSGHKWIYESGLIAQELLQINDLSFAVSGGDYYDTSNNLITQTYNVNYNSVFVYGLAAIKELHQKVKAQETSISSLQTAMLEQQATINSLLTRLQALETGAN